tara:strand:- start:16 stop:423 length:408 start_codon:yes stop_codon:yes gene_type:complete
MAGLAPALPLRKDDIDGYQLLKSYRDVAHQNLKMLILTIPGERIMDPEFGVGLRTYLFRHNNAATYGDIDTKVRSQVASYLPYIEIKKINFTRPEEVGSDTSSVVKMEIRYFIRPLQLFDTLFLDTTIRDNAVSL